MPSTKHNLLTLIVLILVAGSLSAQVKQGNEIGIWAGTAYYKGDINTSLQQISSAREAGGLFFRLNFHDRWSLKTSFDYGYLQGADSLSNNYYQNRRNLSFRNMAFDLSSTIEFNFMERKRKRKFGEFQHFTPYIFTGFALVYHTPEAYINGEWHSLRPLGTEGQNNAVTGNDPYGKIAIALPVGGGFKYYMSKHWAAGLEISYRKVFTDYLDDVSKRYVDPAILASGDNGNLAVALADRSGNIDPPIGTPGKQRGDSAHNDEFVFVGLSLSYVFASMVCPSPKW